MKPFHLDTLKILRRNTKLFAEDKERFHKDLEECIHGSSFLIIGGAGSIGQAVVKEILQYNPRRVHIVDINENALVELIRDLRSAGDYVDTEIKTFALDFGSFEFELYLRSQKPFHYVLNLSALKHVRSEKDPYTLMRMIKVNVIDVGNTLSLISKHNLRKFFSVSTDKAVNPVNAMGATKRLMELTLEEFSHKIPVSSSRFVNVAFSAGSILESFLNRVAKNQPLALPKGIRRYFITQEEAGILCLFATMLSENKDIFIPNLDLLEPLEIKTIASNLLEEIGFEPYFTEDEKEARRRVKELISSKKWPVLLTPPDTTGEKELEVLTEEGEVVESRNFKDLSILKMTSLQKFRYSFEEFKNRIEALRRQAKWEKEEIIKILKEFLPTFRHRETGKYLDDRM